MCAHPHHSSSPSMHRTPTPTSRWNEKDPAVCIPTASHNVSNPHLFICLCLLILMILALHHCLLGCLFLRRTRNQLPPMFLCLYANDHRERQDSVTTACTFSLSMYHKIPESVNNRGLVRNGYCLATFIDCSPCPNLEIAQRFENFVYNTFVTNVPLRYIYHSDLQALETWK
jgi:hypothetical protein